MSGYRFLVLGSGGREHAIAWALAKSPKTAKVFIAPGNPGTAIHGKNINIDINNHSEILEKALNLHIDVVVVGPEQPLVDGIADTLRAEGIAVFGPDQFGAQLEGSKEFAKKMMSEFGVPTASYRSFSLSDLDEIKAYILNESIPPVVLKADGLAGGKGVFICETKEEAIERLSLIQQDETLNAAAKNLVIEEFMDGEEASVFAVCDGTDYVVLSPAQDHKRIGDNDTGLNTGGMGAYTPAPIVTENVLHQVKTNIIEPMLHGMNKKGHPYNGVLYVGLMIKNDDAKVVEFNCRFGDPECQVVVPKLTSDFAELIVKAATGKLDSYKATFSDDFYCSVVLASKGYPESYAKGKKIVGFDKLPPDALVFHSGTTEKSGSILTNGGRVLNVVGKGNHLGEAIQNAYKNVHQIHFDGMYFRTDIGKKGLKETKKT